MLIRNYYGDESNNYKQAEILSEGDEPLDLTWRMYGYGGNDTLIGAYFNDTIEGGSGNDSLRGSLGNDRIFGQQGSDLLYGEQGNDDLFGGDGNDTLYGSSGGDILLGDSGDDDLYGDRDRDSLSGGDGSDRLYGGDSSDTLSGDKEDDLLDGGADDDLLDGYGIGYDGVPDTEFDTLTGGTGADTFKLGEIDVGKENEDPLNAVYYLGDGFATITDFSRSEGDKIQVIGSSEDYSTFVVFGETAILVEDDIIGVVTNTIDVDIAIDFEFI